MGIYLSIKMGGKKKKKKYQTLKRIFHTIPQFVALLYALEKAGVLQVTISNGTAGKMKKSFNSIQKQINSIIQKISTQTVTYDGNNPLNVTTEF